MGTNETSGVGYVLGHSDHEIERLIAQARLYEPFTEEIFRAAGLAEGMRVLDVGCGCGDVSFLVARMVGPKGRVVGVDTSQVAVATAGRRARELGVSNARFLAGEVGALPLDEPFDAAVGRFVLQFSSDPTVMLGAVAARVRPGGVVAFQEVDWSGARALPKVPTFDRCLAWGPEALRRSGADPYMGMKLSAAFASAGLGTPALYLHAALGAGPDAPLYATIASLMHTLLPAMETLGVATAEEVGVDTLAHRISDEVVANGATIAWISLIGASAHTNLSEDRGAS